MDRLDAMTVLVACTDAGSLTAGARKLGSPLPTVSRKIADLERHLRTRLLVRSGRRLTLTDAGAAYVVACRQILESVAEAERAATGEYAAPRGALSVTSSVMLGRLHVAPVAAAFLEAYPDIDLRLILTDGIVNLVEDRVDAAVRIGALPDSSLIAVRVGEVRPVMCASPAYLARRGAPKSLADLAHHDCVTFEGLAGADHWRFDLGGSGVSAIRVHSRLSVTTADAALAATAEGLGVVRVLSYQAAEHFRSGRLVPILGDFAEQAAPVHLIRPPGAAPQKVLAFIDFASSRLRRRLADR